MRKVLLRGTIGAIPGLLMTLVPLLLHDVGVLTGDESQIGFMGLPVLFVGVAIGVLSAAIEAGRGNRAALGMAVGFVLGLATGLLLAATVSPGLWLFTTPAAMIAGGALATGSGTDHRGHGIGDPPTRYA